MTTTITITDILSALAHMDLGPANAAWREGNDSGDGFDPDSEIGGWDLLHAGRTDDEVSVYTDGDDVILVADANGTWAVRVAAEPSPNSFLDCD